MEQNNYRVIVDKILILPDAVETERASGLMIPVASQEKPTWATVVAVGTGERIVTADGVVQIIPLEVGVGDRVQYQRHRAEPVAGTDYLLIKQENIQLVK